MTLAFNLIGLLFLATSVGSALLMQLNHWEGSLARIARRLRASRNGRSMIGLEPSATTRAHDARKTPPDWVNWQRCQVRLTQRSFV